MALKSMPNNKTPGNDDLPKELFGSDIKDVFINSLEQAKIECSLSKIQR